VLHGAIRQHLSLAAEQPRTFRIRGAPADRNQLHARKMPGHALSPGNVCITQSPVAAAGHAESWIFPGVGGAGFAGFACGLAEANAA